MFRVKTWNDVYILAMVESLSLIVEVFKFVRHHKIIPKYIFVLILNFENLVWSHTDR